MLGSREKKWGRSDSQPKDRFLSLLPLQALRTVLGLFAWGIESVPTGIFTSSEVKSKGVPAGNSPGTSERAKQEVRLVHHHLRCGSVEFHLQEAGQNL